MPRNVRVKVVIPDDARVVAGPCSFCGRVSDETTLRHTAECPWLVADERQVQALFTRQKP